jgi:hypothetical protein
MTAGVAAVADANVADARCVPATILEEDADTEPACKGLTLLEYMDMIASEDAGVDGSSSAGDRRSSLPWEVSGASVDGVATGSVHAEQTGASACRAHWARHECAAGVGKQCVCCRREGRRAGAGHAQPAANSACAGGCGKHRQRERTRTAQA